MNYVVYFVIAAVAAVAVTPLVRRFAFRTGCVDVPRPPRHLHSQPVAKLGGLAVFIAIATAAGLYLFSGALDPFVVPPKFIYSMLGGALVLVIGGFFDDKYNLPPYILWIFPALAGLIVVISGVGIGITSISNPFGGSISLDYPLLGIPASGIFIWLWLQGMMYTTKFLDGLDGLVAGIGVIASATLFALSLTEKVNQPITATLAIMLCGALAGYLIYAFNPAKIFLGEGGSTLVGFMLGVLSIILGGKIATALLVMGIPILDVAWVIAQRIWYGRSPWRGDRLHLHFRLLDLGFSQRQTALLLYGISAVFGFTAVFLQSMGKLVALGIMFALMGILLVGLIISYRRKFTPQR